MSYFASDWGSESKGWITEFLRHYGVEVIAEPLSRDEEILLIRRFQERPLSEDLRRQFIRQYIGLVVASAIHYSKGLRILQPEDLANTALERMVDIAIRKFDLRRGTRFSTYATYWIRREMGALIIRQKDTFRLPDYQNNLVILLMRVQAELMEDFGRPPTIEEIADLSGLPLHSLETTLEAVKLKNLVSLDAEETKSGKLVRSVADTLQAQNKDDNDLARTLGTREEINQLLECLTAKEREALILFYGLNGNHSHTGEEISHLLEVSHQRIHQLKASALKKIRATGKRICLL